MTNVVQADFDAAANTDNEPNISEMFYFASPRSNQKKIDAKWALFHKDDYDVVDYDFVEQFKNFIDITVNGYRTNCSPDPQDLLREMSFQAIMHDINTCEEFAGRVCPQLSGEDVRDMFMDYVGPEHPYNQQFKASSKPKLSVVGR